MRGYNFQLESILEWRTNIEKSTIEEFALVQRELEKQRQILNNLIEKHSKAKNNTKYNNIHEIRQHQIYISDLEDKVGINEVFLDEIRDKLEEARKELLVAQKDRKVMEKLREKDFEEYITDMKTREQKELDEIGIFSYQNRIF